jgi:Ni/Co efflux regulator RcnB
MTKIILSLLLGSIAWVNVACADPPPGKGGGKNRDADWHAEKGKGKGRDDGPARERERSQRSDVRDDKNRDSSRYVSRHFEDRHRTIIREYYSTEYRSGHCPPGLAKKNNGCMPPGQAKKWHVGHPLPRDVIYYELPTAVVVRIGAPPAGHRYVRVAADILLIAIGTGMVIDAIEDLSSM